jgi:hypothetical protein
MAYIGRQNLGGAYRQLDDISSGFDGSDTTHTMQVNSQNVTVGDVNQIILSLGGVIQKPGTDFTVSGSVLTFTTAPAANTSFFAVLLGSDNGGTTTPTDASVTTAKFASGVAIGATGTANTLAGIPFFSDTTNGSIYTHDVSGTDDTAADNTAFGLNALDAITTGDYNVAIGKNALSANNTGHSNVAVGAGSQLSMTSGNTNTSVGNNALYSCTVGDRNTAVGANAFYALEPSSNSDMENVAVGFSAGRFNTTGDYNTFLGAQAGYSVTTGAQNTLIGRYAGGGFDTEDHNLAIGRNALGGSVAGGEQNVCIGNYTGDAITSGDYNVAVGYQTLSSCTTGYSNKAFGWGALHGVTEGFRNVGLGHQAGYGITTGDNNICIGYDSGRSSSPSGNITTANNTICLGDDNIANFFCADTSISSSDKRDKTDVTNFTAGLDFIEKMQPVTYKWDKRSWYSDDLSVTPDGSKKATETNVGFLAQDVETLEKEIGFANNKNDMLFVNLSEDDKRYGMKYERLVTVLVNAVKELSAKVKTLESK